MNERSGNSRPANEGRDFKWMMIFGAIITVAVLVAVIIMSVQGIRTLNERKKADIRSEETDAYEDVLADEDETETDDAISVEIESDADESTGADPAVTAEVTAKVERIAIRYYDEEKTEFTMHIGDKLTLNAYILPAAASSNPVEWVCSDENGNCLKVTQNEEDGSLCELECVGSTFGGVKLTVKSDGLEANCQIYLLP